MERRPVYSIFPAPPTAHPSQQRQHQHQHQQEQHQHQQHQQQEQQKARQSTDSKTRSSLEGPPYPPPSSPLPPLPHSQQPSHTAPLPPQQPLPPTPDSLKPVRRPSRRRKASPNREFADFQRELAQSSKSPEPPVQQAFPSASRSHPIPPWPRRSASSRPSQTEISSVPAQVPTDISEHDMQNSTLSTSSTSSLSLSKPPLLSPSPTVIPSPMSQVPGRHQRPTTVYFHGSIGGAGNYRKVIRDHNKAPRAYAENAEPVRRSSPTRFLSSLFGSQKVRAPDHAAVLDERASGSEDSSMRDEVDLGAAEALRRKMMGVGRRKKGGS